MGGSSQQRSARVFVTREQLTVLLVICAVSVATGVVVLSSRLAESRQQLAELHVVQKRVRVKLEDVRIDSRVLYEVGPDPDSTPHDAGPPDAPAPDSYDGLPRDPRKAHPSVPARARRKSAQSISSPSAPTDDAGVRFDAERIEANTEPDSETPDDNSAPFIYHLVNLSTALPKSVSGYLVKIGSMQNETSVYFPDANDWLRGEVFKSLQDFNIKHFESALSPLLQSEADAGRLVIMNLEATIDGLTVEDGPYPNAYCSVSVVIYDEGHPSRRAKMSGQWSASPFDGPEPLAIQACRRALRFAGVEIWEKIRGLLTKRTAENAGGAEPRR